MLFDKSVFGKEIIESDLLFTKNTCHITTSIKQNTMEIT